MGWYADVFVITIMDERTLGTYLQSAVLERLQQRKQQNKPGPEAKVYARKRRVKSARYMAGWVIEKKLF